MSAATVPIRVGMLLGQRETATGHAALFEVFDVTEGAVCLLNEVSKRREWLTLSTMRARLTHGTLEVVRHADPDRSE